MRGDCSEREKGEFRLEELPQGPAPGHGYAGVWGQAIVVGGGRVSSDSKSCRGASAGTMLCAGAGRRQDIVLSGRMGSSGSKSCRKASAGILFCVGLGEGEGGRILF